MRNNIVITGGCGHIGSLLTRVLAKDNNVIVVDNMLTQRYSSLFLMQNKIKFIEADFLHFLPPTDSTVIHLAAITDAANSFKNDNIEQTNIEDTSLFIDICVREGVSKFIFPSSTSVYGVAADLVNEDDKKFENPQSPYAESKLKIEQYLESGTGNMKHIIPRFGTIFGFSPGIRFHTAINKFIYQSALGLPITVWKQNYEQVRPYLGLTDCINSVKHILTLPDSSWNTKYNIITANYKLSTIVELLKIQYPELQMKEVDTPLLNQFSYNVDDSKIRATGFVPTSNLEHEISFTSKILRNLC